MFLGPLPEKFSLLTLLWDMCAVLFLCFLMHNWT
jgi:hypothetical protein